MKYKELDLPLICSVALEPALKQYAEYLPPMPDNAIPFIHDWNARLLSAAGKTKNLGKLGAVGKAVASIKSPNLTKLASDKLISPARCFDYALRFTTAYNFCINFITQPRGNYEYSVVVDFGAGLSPLLTLLNTNMPDNYFIRIDKQGVNDFYNSLGKDRLAFEGILTETNFTPRKCGLITANNARSALVSLGTFPYFSQSEQRRNLALAEQNFDEYFIELERKNPDYAPSKLDPAYSGEWTHGQIYDMIDCKNGRHTLRSAAAQLSSQARINMREKQSKLLAELEGRQNTSWFLQKSKQAAI
jgi:hypothetical protein